MSVMSDKITRSSANLAGEGRRPRPGEAGWGRAAALSYARALAALDLAQDLAGRPRSARPRGRPRLRPRSPARRPEGRSAGAAGRPRQGRGGLCAPHPAGVRAGGARRLRHPGRRQAADKTRGGRLDGGGVFPAGHRGEISETFGREISRDLIAALREQGLIAAGPRSPRLGAPCAYVTTEKFLLEFGFESLRDLPDLEALKDAGGIVRSIFRTVFGCGSFRPWATRSDISTARQRSFVWSC